MAALLLAAAVAGTPRDTLAQVRLPPITVEARSAAPDRDQPPAVTTITPEELEAAGVENTRDLSALAPNLIVQEAGDRKSSFIGIRGL